MAVFEKMLLRSRGELRQFLVLSRHFFGRLFQNDVVAFEDQMKEKLIAGIAMLAVFGGHIANATLMKYFFVRDDGLSWLEKCYFLSLFMTVMGFLTVLEWDVIFPDIRDSSNLMSLPVRMRTFLASKMASFLVFVTIYSLGSNLIATIVFPYFLAEDRSKSPLFLLAFAGVHLLTVLAANLFIFFSSVLILGLLMAVLPHRLFKKISLIFRFALLTGLLFIFIFHISDTLGYGLPRSFSSLPELKESGAAFVFAYPPMWFTGFYESLLGTQDPVFRELGRRAILAVASCLALFIPMLALSYRRHIKKSLEAAARRPHGFRARRLFSYLFNRLLLPHPVQRSVFSFFGRTLARSAHHKMRLVSSAAVAIALILILLASMGFGARSVDVWSRNIFAIPLILSFFFLVGLRGMVEVPFSAEARWVFEITEIESKRHYPTAVKKAIFFYVLVPLFGLLSVVYVRLWGWEKAGSHALFGLLVSTCLLEVLFLSYPKIPFACTFVPGKARIHTRWIFYVTGFAFYTSGLSRYEKEIFWSQADFRRFLLFLTILIAVLEAAAHLRLYKKMTMIYEEEPESVMVTLTDH